MKMIMNAATECIVAILGVHVYTAKNVQFATSLLFTSCNNLLQQGCVRMACVSLLTTNLLQVINLIVQTPNLLSTGLLHMF